MKEKKRQISMSDGLWREIGEVANDIGLKDTRGSHSQLVRQVMSAVVSRWLRSPYVARSSNHLVLVTANAAELYRLTEVLRLNSDREKLPFFAEMRREKKRFFRSLNDYRSLGQDFIRDQWILNYFGVWSGSRITGPLLSSSTDVENITSKVADLPVGALPGRVLTRELVVGISNYALRREAGGDVYDRAGILVGVPTQALEFTVVVDEALYSATHPTGEELSNLSLELRNVDGARFVDRDFLDSENPIEQQRGRGGTELASKADPGADLVLADLESFQSRWEELVDAETDTGPVVPEADRRDAARKVFEIPQRFRFLRLSWTSPQHGVEVCVHWERPVGSQ